MIDIKAGKGGADQSAGAGAGEGGPWTLTTTSWLLSYRQPGGSKGKDGAADCAVGLVGVVLVYGVVTPWVFSDAACRVR